MSVYVFYMCTLTEIVQTGTSCFNLRGSQQGVASGKTWMCSTQPPQGKNPRQQKQMMHSLQRVGPSQRPPRRRVSLTFCSWTFISRRVPCQGQGGVRQASRNPLVLQRPSRCAMRGGVYIYIYKSIYVPYVSVLNTMLYI